MIEENPAAMRAAVIAAVEAGETRRRRERSLRGKLTHMGFRLHAQRDGYVVACAYAPLEDGLFATLDEVEAWTEARRAKRRAL